MKIQTVHMMSVRSLLSGMGIAKINQQFHSQSAVPITLLSNQKSRSRDRNYSAAAPPPPIVNAVVNNVTLNNVTRTRARNIGTHVRPSVLVKDHLPPENLSLNETVYSLVSKDVLHEVSLKSLLDDNPEVKRFILKVAMESAGSETGSGAGGSMDNDKKTRKDGDVEGDDGKPHPFIQVAGDLFFQEDDYPASLSTPGILVYLMGKLFQRNPYDDHSEFAKKIRHLSKSVNHSCAAFRIHRTIQDSNRKPVWNKLATLAGDLLVVECIRNVASIRDNELLLWTMNSLADFSSAEFQVQAQQKGQLTRQLVLKPEGSLLSTGFRGVAKLAGRPDPQLQRQLNHLGMTLGYLWMEFESGNNNDRQRTTNDSIQNQSDSLTVNAMMDESMDILTQQFHGADSDITEFFKDFILHYYSQSKSQLSTLLEQNDITNPNPNTNNDIDTTEYSHKNIFHVI